MPMTEPELAAHADRMAELLTAKRRQIKDEEMGPDHRAHLLLQVDALTLRVDEIKRQCEKMRAQTVAAGDAWRAREAAADVRRAEASVSRALIQAAHTSPT